MMAPHHSGKLHKRLAISEMLAVIILLALAVVAGVLVYQIFMGKASVASTNTAISIQSASINGQILTIVIQNTGSNTINSISVNEYPSVPSFGASTPPNTPLSPGQSTSGVYTGSFAPGQQYTITVTATSNTGGSTVATVTVTAN